MVLDAKSAVGLETAGEWSRAASVYRDLLRVANDPDERTFLQLRLGNCLFEDSDLDEAGEILAEAARSAETAADRSLLGQVRLTQGLIELERGHMRQASERLTGARELLGDTPRLLLAECAAMREHGELQGALTTLTELRERDLEPRELADLLDELGAVHLARGDFAMAEQVLREALELDSRVSSEYHTAKSKLLLAKAVMGQGHRREAKRLLESAAESYDEAGRGLSEVYMSFGEWCEDGADYLGATKYYRLARDVDRESEDVVGQARALRNLARVYRLRGDRDRGEETLREASKLLEGLDDDVERAALFIEQGYQLVADVDYPHAIERFRLAFAVAKDDNEDRAIAVAQRGLALALSKDGQLEAAKELLLKAGPVLEERGDLRALDDLMDDLGEVCIELNEYDEALGYLERSLALDERLGTAASKARSLLLMGKAHLRRGDRRDAGERLVEALDVYKESDDDEGKADALLEYGSWLAEEGDIGESLDRFKEALRIASRHEDSIGIAAAQRGIASIYRRRREFERADETLRSAQAELRTKDDPMATALLAAETARLAIDMGEWHLAEASLREATRALNDTHSPVQRAMVDRLLARVYAADAKSRPKALELLKKAEEVLLVAHDYPELDDLYDDMALVYLEMRQYDSALEAVQQSLKIGREMGWDRGNGRSLLIMARIQMLQGGKQTDARRSLQEAAEAFDRARDDPGRSDAALLLGDWYVDNGDLDKAILSYKDARRIDRGFGDLRGVGRALRKLGEAYLRKGEYSRAEESFDQAEDYFAKLDLVEEAALLAFARGRLHAMQGDHTRALRELSSALTSIDALQLEDERVAIYKALASSHHALGEYDMAMRCMRQMGLEQAAIWGSLLDSFDSRLRDASQSAYLRGDYETAVAHAFNVLESELRRRVESLTHSTSKQGIPAIANAWYMRNADPDTRDTVEGHRRNLCSEAFALFRNPVAHGRGAGDGATSFCALSIVNYLLTSLDASED